MKNTILYTRVSTDDQADHGFSLPYQKEVLDRFCNLKNHNILRHFQDDYSAKTFDRPEWKKLMLYCKANRKIVDEILFTKWDRFSRNTGEAYQVIDSLRRMGIKVNSIEQPLDLELPDNKIMLAIYLAVPEVENDKISIRTTEGSRRANKEGCWTSTAPIGYKNQRTLEGKASLIQSDKAELIKESFILMTRGLPADEVRRMMYKKGLKISKSRFHILIRNPVYNGKVKVPAYKNEDMYYVEGLHDAIVSDNLFNRVQEILEGRKKKKKKWATKNENLPLRGHIKCTKCGKNLTGSASTGRWGGKYYYYHCRLGCRERFKVDEAHQMFEELLESYTIDRGVSELYYDVISEKYGNNKRVRTTKMNKIEKEIKDLKEIISTAEDNLFEGKIDITTFEKGKAKYQKKIADLEFDYTELKNHGVGYMKQIKKALKLFENLKTLYNDTAWEGKQILVGSIFSEKIFFKNNECRTPRFNIFLEDIFLKTNMLHKIKTGQNSNISNLSCPVTSAGFKPATS